MSPFLSLLTCTSVITTAPPSPAQEAWRWPLAPVPRVLRTFTPPPAPWLAGHRGVDLAARPAQAVLAAGSGRVTYAGRLAGRGVVAITHGATRTTYLPVRPSVRRDEAVRAGSRIGVLEATPHCSVPCLHWGLLDATGYRDPLPLVRPQIRLLPRWRGTPKTLPPHRPREPRKPDREEPFRPDLRDASTATGGAMTGMLLAFALMFAQRRRPARRPPPGVIDLDRERRLRRAR